MADLENEAAFTEAEAYGSLIEKRFAWEESSSNAIVTTWLPGLIILSVFPVIPWLFFYIFAQRELFPHLQFYQLWIITFLVAWFLQNRISALILKKAPQAIERKKLLFILPYMISKELTKFASTKEPVLLSQAQKLSQRFGKLWHELSISSGTLGFQASASTAQAIAPTGLSVPLAEFHWITALEKYPWVSFGPDTATYLQAISAIDRRVLVPLAGGATFRELPTVFSVLCKLFYEFGPIFEDKAASSAPILESLQTLGVLFAKMPEYEPKTIQLQSSALTKFKEKVVQLLSGTFGSKIYFVRLLSWFLFLIVSFVKGAQWVCRSFAVDLQTNANGVTVMGIVITTAALIAIAIASDKRQKND